MLMQMCREDEQGNAMPSDVSTVGVLATKIEGSQGNFYAKKIAVSC